MHKLFDSHAHVYMNHYENDRKEIIEQTLQTALE